MRQAVVFGAGSVGRGFVGQLLCDAGWMVTFLDVAPELVSALARDGGYLHVTVSNLGTERRMIGPVTALDSRDPAAVNALLHADLAVSSVGARALPDIADTLAKAIAKRVGSGSPPLNVLLAENLHGVGNRMRALLARRLPGTPVDVLDAQVGLLETSIGRMIPSADPGVRAGGSTTVVVEPYAFLPYDAAATRGRALDIPGLVADTSVPFAFYADRKLYIHNMGHCFTAYLGEFVGAEAIWQAIAKPEIRYLVRAAMVESAIGLAARFNVPPAGLVGHVEDLLHRFGNRGLGDSVLRVGRDPVRKLAADDRLLGALTLAASGDLPGHHVSLAVAAGALKAQRQVGWNDEQVWEHLTASLAPDVLEPRRELLSSQLAGLKTGFDFSAQIALIGQAYEPSTVV